MLSKLCICKTLYMARLVCIALRGAELDVKVKVKGRKGGSGLFRVPICDELCSGHWDIQVCL